MATVIGGIDCAESAASVGDDFHTPTVIGVEAFATLLAAFCGGVIQTTPYIGHPAYKAMGGRAAYTLATALFVGAAGLIGYFSLMFAWISQGRHFPDLDFYRNRNHGLQFPSHAQEALRRNRDGLSTCDCKTGRAQYHTLCHCDGLSVRGP